MAVMTVPDVEQIYVHPTGSDEDISFQQVVRSHRLMGRFGCGSHFVITRDGEIHRGRELTQPGVGMPGGNNRSTVGIQLVAGESLTAPQDASLSRLVEILSTIYPDAALVESETAPRQTDL